MCASCGCEVPEDARDDDQGTLSKEGEPAGEMAGRRGQGVE